MFLWHHDDIEIEREARQEHDAMNMSVLCFTEITIDGWITIIEREIENDLMISKRTRQNGEEVFGVDLEKVWIRIVGLITERVDLILRNEQRDSPEKNPPDGHLRVAEVLLRIMGSWIMANLASKIMDPARDRVSREMCALNYIGTGIDTELFRDHRWNTMTARNCWNRKQNFEDVEVEFIDLPEDHPRAGTAERGIVIRTANEDQDIADGFEEPARYEVEKDVDPERPLDPGNRHRSKTRAPVHDSAKEE